MTRQVKNDTIRLTRGTKMKLYILGLALIISGCAGYQVVYTCDKYHCFNQAVMPWQEAPEAFFTNDDKTEINDDQCLAMLNLVAKHNGLPKVEAPVSCTK